MDTLLHVISMTLLHVISMTHSCMWSVWSKSVQQLQEATDRSDDCISCPVSTVPCPRFVNTYTCLLWVVGCSCRDRRFCWKEKVEDSHKHYPHPSWPETQLAIQWCFCFREKHLLCTLSMMLWSQIPSHKISVILFWKNENKKKIKETLCEACLQPCPWFTSFISEGISKVGSYWESAHNFTHKGHQVIHAVSSDFSCCTSCAVFLRVGDRRPTPVYATANARGPIIMYNHSSNPFPVCTIAV